MKTIKNVLRESVRCSRNNVAYPQLYVKEVNLLIELIKKYELAKRIILVLITIIILQALPSDIMTDSIEPISNDNFRIEEAKAHDLEVYKKNIGEQTK